METDELIEALDSLTITGTNRANLLADQDRAAGWILWLRDQTGIANPAGLLIARFRTGDWAPDPNAWRGTVATGAPDYAKALRCCEAIVRNCGHELEENGLVDEFDRLCGHPKIGAGATLTDHDRARLLHTAATMRAKQAAAPDRQPEDLAWTVGYYTDLVRRRVLTVAQMRAMTDREQVRWVAVCAGVERALRPRVEEVAA